MAAGEKKNVKRKKAKKKVQAGVVHINARYNNTIVTVTDMSGNALESSSAAACGYKGARKSTPFAASEALTTAVQKAIDNRGMKTAAVIVKGPGPGRDSIRGFSSLEIKVTSIKDMTGVPFNGCRDSKERRV